MSRQRRWVLVFSLVGAVALGSFAVSSGSAAPAPAGQPVAAAAAAPNAPNIFFYNLDDLRDAFPGAIDPLQFMPKTRAWMADGTRFTQSFVADPSCCPSRSSLMTGRYPHNNGVRNQQDGPMFDGAHSMACYLKSGGYATYMAGKFLTTWPKTSLPPCFDHSTVMWGGYNDVSVKVDGVSKKAAGYNTTYLGNQGRSYITQALNAATKPFLLYETPQAPHWVNVTQGGTTTQLAVPEAQYATANVGTCSGVPEADRADKPAYVRSMNYSTAKAQALCQSQMRAIMSADDQFDATMQLLQTRGVLANTLVIFSSDNGYMWGEHGRWEKFVAFEPAIRVPMLVRWPGHFSSGVNTTRIVSYLDLLPTMMQAAGIAVPAGAPALDGQSLLQPGTRTTMYSEYYNDPANKNIPSWRMVRQGTIKFVRTFNPEGGVVSSEYYNLATDPAENTNLLGDANAANDPTAAQINALVAKMNSFSTCSGPSCIT